MSLSYPQTAEVTISIVLEGSRHHSGRDWSYESSARALRRAASRIRRYAVANGLDRLVTLTSARVDELLGMQGRVRAFKRRLFARLRKVVPMVVVIGRGSGGRLHAHVLLGCYVPEATLQTCWDSGFIAARRFKAPSGGRAAARRAAAYVSQHLPTLEAERAVGDHRYEVSQGFAPKVVRTRFSTPWEAFDAAVEAHCGELPRREVSSCDLAAYRGPPWWWASWAA